VSLNDSPSGSFFSEHSGIVSKIDATMQADGAIVRSHATAREGERVMRTTRKS
jgi:hypothetical protein